MNAIGTKELISKMSTDFYFILGPRAGLTNRKKPLGHGRVKFRALKFKPNNS